MAQSPAIPWIIRITLMVHFLFVCVWGLYARGYLPELEGRLPQPIQFIVALVGMLSLLACPLTILVLAMVRPSRAMAYAIIAEILLIYASTIAALPAVQ